MDEIYAFLISKLNYDLVYLIKKDVDIYNNKCKFRYCLQQIINIKRDYDYYYKFDENKVSKFILKRNKHKMKLINNI